MKPPGANTNDYLYNKLVRSTIEAKRRSRNVRDDPQICRWNSIDPADEFFSPYLYVGNDPINYLDPDGFSEIHFDMDGNEWVVNEDFWLWDWLIPDTYFFHDGYGNVAPAAVVYGEVYEVMDLMYVRNITAGVISNLSFGTTDLLLDQMGDLGSIDSRSEAYSNGELTGTIVGVASGGKGLWNAGKSLLKKSAKVYKHSFKYAKRVRMRGVQDPLSHNFPYSFDDAILSTKPILKNNGYKMFQQTGTMNGKKGVFEIGLTKDGIIDHRFFRPIK